MARSYPLQEMSDPAGEPRPGEWQALRGELVALLDQVEGRYAQVEQPEPALTGLTQRVRNLRDQVVGPEPSVRRREALRTVKRAVDRFNERDDIGEEQDALTSAIAEIRGRQMSGSAAALGRRVSDQPEFRDLNALVSGLSGRLEQLEGELKSQRASNGSVREVASQVEQLTHVVELLAGAVGETGQVKRLESQIGALAALIETGSKVDLSAINGRLDDVSATVGKLAELQAQQMEREIAREERRANEPVVETAGALSPVMRAIEKSVRNVYDRIDSIEKNIALSSGDFERLTSEMAAFTQAMKDGAGAPSKLVAKVDALAARIGDFDTSNGDVVGLREDISALRNAVMTGMEPRFNRIESQIEALAERITPSADSTEVESQLKLLMQRMDEAGSQLDGLAKLYAAPAEATNFEAMATLVAERTSDALTRKAPAPVAMLGPDSFKSIEDRLTGLIKSASKAPDYETLATMVAEKTSAAVAKSAPAPASGDISPESINVLEQRVTALLNTAGKDTAERLTRLEAALTARSERTPAESAAPVAPPVLTPKPPKPAESRVEKLDAMLATLGSPASDVRRDAMLVNPADEMPRRDPGFKDSGPVRTGLDAKITIRPQAAQAPSEPTIDERPTFDIASVERPPRPQSSFAETHPDPFAPVASAAIQVEAPASQNSTSTFVAAARRAQRAHQETTTPAPSGNSAISRALSRFKPTAPAQADAESIAAEVVAPVITAGKPARPEKPVKEKRVKLAEAATVAPTFGLDDDPMIKQSFLKRYRRALLLGAVVILASALALNLVMQRLQVAELATPVSPRSVEPSATEDVSVVKPEPRIIDMIDGTATASINPAMSSTFNRKGAAAPMPGALLALAAADADTVPLDVPAEATPETGSIPDIATVPQTFELPPEGVGPIELRQAAADGDARAQFEIGAIYTEGRAIPQDYVEAAKWYERSAAQGFVPAQYRLGNLYEVGTGVEKDIEVAKLWYQRGAEAGNRMAMHNLAALYAGGQMGEQEFETAAEWFQQAAARGMTDSQFNLGMLYARGLGVQQDFEQSYKWFSLAAQRGDADAAKARDDIAKSLNADAVGRIGAEVSAWNAEPIDLAANFAPLGTWSPTFDPGEAIITRDVVSKVQQALAKLGFDVGSPDGLAGPKTAEAIKTFERNTGMSESGMVNPRLLAVLGSQPV